jgi:hypothetical protein
MLVFLIAGAIAGILLGIRFKVLILVPASLLAAVVVIVTGSSHDLGPVVLTLLGTVASLQFGYVVGSLLRTLFRARFPAAESHKRDSFAFKRFFHD